MKALKAWLIALTVAAGLTWMASSLSFNGMGASSGRQAESAESSSQESPSAKSRSGDEKRRDGMGGMGMMNGMMSMMGGGSMMEGCPMMNDKRPNDQWQPSKPAR
jgi:hypothetical protein